MVDEKPIMTCPSVRHFLEYDKNEGGVNMACCGKKDHVDSGCGRNRGCGRVQADRETCSTPNRGTVIGPFRAVEIRDIRVQP